MRPSFRCALESVLVAISTLSLVLSVPVHAQSRKPIPIYDPARQKSNAKNMPHTAVPQDDSNSSCTLLTFEGLGDLAAIPTFEGISMPDWLSIIQDTDGGSGNFANAPSGVTIAFWLYGNPTSQTIDVPNGATTLSLYYSSYYSITLTGYDADGNQLSTATGPPNFDSSTGVYDIWSPLTLTAPSGKTIASMAVAGYANYTGIDNLNVCQSASIASVEATQAIQQYQKLDDLKTSLQANGEPPVPMIAGKPAVLRTYFNPLQVATDVTLKISGVLEQSLPVTLPPNCTPDMERSNSGACKSVDFYFTPPTGSWQATLDVLDGSGNIVEEENLPFTSRTTNSLRMRGVTVCDAKDSAGGWLCDAASNLLGKTSLLEKLAPTQTVTATTSSYFVRNDIATFPNADAWDDATAKNVNDLYGFYDSVGDYFAGRYTDYFGMVRPPPAAPAPDPLDGIGGQAYDIPSHGAFGRSTFPIFGSDVSVGVVAHETGHTLNLKHTNTDLPMSNSLPGCFAVAGDDTTDWSYPTGTPASPSNTNYIQSSAVSGAPTYEVGFDVAAMQPVSPQANLDVMSYCAPFWVSPQRYKTMIATLGGGAVTSPSAKGGAANSAPQANAALPAAAPSPFWHVSGTIISSAVTFDPLFTMTTQGNSSEGSGTYSLVVEGSSGIPLFTRLFTPVVSYRDPFTKTGSTSNPTFAESIPVTANAKAIVLLSPENAELGRITLGGTAPSVTITSPTAGFSGVGEQTISWTVQGATAFTSQILYSPDNGATWSPVGEIKDGETYPIDFDKLPGSSQSLIQILVSDGVNTGSATSVPFSVPKKKPSVALISSPKPGFAQPSYNPVYLSGSVYDTDDGTLSGSALAWSSNIQGALGTGSPLTVKLKPGEHTLTLTGTDSDGNIISTTVAVVIGGAPPTVSLKVQELNEAPTTCEFVTIGAAAGAANGAPLSTAQYSLDGGLTYSPIPLSSLPYGFLVPESGFVHLVAHSADVSGQTATQDTTFFAQSGCTLTPQTITFAPLASQVYGVAPINLAATASSGLPVSFSVTGAATLTSNTLKITGAGSVTVTASQAGNTTYAPANLVSRTFQVAQASLTVKAANASRPSGAPNPTFTYAITGFVNGDTLSVVSGAATLTTTATSSSPVGTYPISFSSEGLTAGNYSFTYVPATLTVTSSGTPASPTFSPMPGTYATAQSVKLTATTGAGIYYTINGSKPTAGSTLYTGPISVAATETIEAIAILNGVSSSVASGTYTISTASGCNLIDYSSGFSSTAGLTLNGGATVANNLLQLTDGKESEARSVFYSTPVPFSTFVTDFTFQLTDPVADGFTFTIQSDGTTALGLGGGSLGYAGIAKSVAVKFDLHNNDGEGINSTGLYEDGAFPGTPSVDLTPSGIDLHSGHVFAVHIGYSGTTGTITITDTTTHAEFSSTDMLSNVPVGDKAYVGFTAGTGKSSATQNILTWTYGSGSGCSTK